MTKTFYAIFSYIVVAVLVYCAVNCAKRRDKIGKYVAALLSIGAFSIVGYTIIFFTSSYLGMSIGNCIFFVGMDWLCYTMLLFAIEYTKQKGKPIVPVNRWLNRLVIVILIIDSVSMLCNIVYEHAMKFQVIYAYRGERFLRFRPQPLFYLHLSICYILFGLALAVFWRKIRLSPRIYQLKYGFISLTLLTVVVVNALFLIFKPFVDISIYTYAIAAILMNYFTFHYIPKYLEQYMQRLAQDRQQDMIIMFDNEDNCVYRNSNMSIFLKDRKIDKDSFEEVWDYEDATHKTAILMKNGEKQIFVKEYELLSDDSGKYMGCFYVMHDITKERELQERYRFLATHDTLTGLYNRNYFFEKAEAYMKKNPHEQYLMICSDIHHFKAVNDIFGTDAGDRILKVIADDLKQADDDDRVYGRVAGDSFALCMPGKNFKTASYLIKNGSVLHIKDINYPIVNHIGIYEVEDLSLSVAAMCDRAMLAINSIKDDMQQQIAYYDDRLREELLQEQEILKDLTPAFEEKQFTIYLQPQFCHSTGEIVGAETLVRWNHPEKGIILPYIFIPMMEENGLISKLDRYVWRMACELLKKCERNGKKISLSVNISPKDFYYLDLYHEFMSLVQEYGISPSQLKLEITESAVMLDVSKQVALIEKLQAEGFIVEMDDFGSGYSSLNTLKDIPVDILKLDIKFMEKSKHADRSADILQMVIAMADRLHMPVIAEGVETEEQADFLGSIGCDIIQGYYYAEPMSISEFEALLQKCSYRDIVESKG